MTTTPPSSSTVWVPTESLRGRVEWERFAMDVLDEDVDVDFISGDMEFTF